jgi:hypothetical protein
MSSLPQNLGTVGIIFVENLNNWLRSRRSTKRDERCLSHLDGRCLSVSLDDIVIELDAFEESLNELVKLVELETFVELDEQDKLEGSLGLLGTQTICINKRTSC